jgi:pSer/pThr/pTyr-binding forkhead associated (FHA) protein
MDAEFRYLDGAFAGQVRIVRKDFATVGRHPSADLPFDASRDLDVSGRHAAVFRQSGRWMVRDLGSSNGTWVNGTRLKGDRALSPGDVLRFGSGGPQLRFQPATGDTPTVPATAIATAEGSSRGRGAPDAIPPRRATTERIRAEVHRQTAGWKRATIALAVIALLASSALGVLAVRRSRAVAELRNRLLSETDSLLEHLRGASSSVAALQAELARAREETSRLRAGIADRSTDREALDSFSERLRGSLPTRRGLLGAARFDQRAIDSANGEAVGVVVSELPGGRSIAGTGFAVAARGDTGWIVTARHLVVDSAGRRALRLGFLFNGSSQNFRARLVGVADSVDLALLMVRVRGGVPAVRGFGDMLRGGDPVAALGFPVGLDPAGRWRSEGVRAVGFTGTTRGVGPDLVELDSYGVSGSSGSPLFAADGRVVGMVFGGDPASAGRIVYAVPAKAIEQLLAKLRVSP